MKKSSEEKFEQFWKGQETSRRILELFTFLPDACVCVKDRSGQYVWANQAQASLHGYHHQRLLLGKNDFDVYERHIAEQFAADDQQLMATKTSAWNQTWLLSDHFRRLRWFVCSKVPLFEEGKDATGIAIVMRQLAQTQPMVAAYEGMEVVLSAIVNHHAEPLRIQDLANLVYLSHSQFDRRFKEIFHVTPQQYILQVRLRAVCHALCHTDDSIAEIALKTGFADQAHLSRLFRKEMKMTPLAFRKQYHKRAQK